MTITIGVLSLDSDFVSGTASYFEPTSFLAAFGVPTDTDSMADGVGEFDLDATSLICARIQANNGDVLRTGIQPAAAVGEIENGVLELPYVIYPVTEALAYSDLVSNIPPISEGNATVSNMAISRSGSNLVASADASFDTGIFGNINGNFTYEFRLVPVTSAMSSSILKIETVDIDLNLSGIAGWLLNGYIDALLFLFEGRIGDLIEDEIQGVIDTAIAERLSEQGDVPDNIQATVRSVSLSATEATVDALVAVPAIAIDCPFNVADGSVKIRRGEQLRQLRRMRSQVLKGNPRGEIYIAMMRRHGRELARIVRKDRALLKKFDALVTAGLKDFNEDRPGDGKLKKRTATLAQSLAAEVRESASPGLRRAIEAHAPDINDFVGKPVTKVLEDSTAKAGEIAKGKLPKRRKR